MAIGKTFRLRVLNKSGTFIAQTTSFSFTNFRKVINGGLGDLTIKLPLTFDGAYQNAMCTLFNRVQVYVGDYLLYSGFVAGIIPKITGNNEEVTIVCRGHASRFAFLPLKNSNTTKLYTDTSTGLKTSASASAAALDLVLKTIIDRYNAEATYPLINYNSTSVAASANTWTYTLSTKSIQYAIEKVMENAPAGWYWRVGADNVFYFKNKSSTADIVLNYETQINELEDAQLIDDLANQVLIQYNGSPPANAVLTSDSTSTTAYGDWWLWKTDGRYTVAGNITNVANSILDAKKNPVRRMRIVVPDSAGSKSTGYDTEFIEPGMTLKINNLPVATALVMPTLFQIVAVDYAPDAATLELETPADDLAREVAKKERNDDQEATEDGPATYS